MMYTQLLLPSSLHPPSWSTMLNVQSYHIQQQQQQQQQYTLSRNRKILRAKDKLWTIPRAATLQVHLNHGKCIRLAARIVQSRAKYEEGLRDGREIELLPQEEEILMADWMYMEDYSKQGPCTEIPLYGDEWDWGGWILFPLV